MPLKTNLPSASDTPVPCTLAPVTLANDTRANEPQQRPGQRHEASATRQNRLTRRNLICVGAVVCCLLFVNLAGCKKDTDDTAAATITNVEAAHPTYGPITEYFTADAVLSPVAQAAILPKIVAPVRRFYVQRGARVRAGQLLATLENSDLRAAVIDNKGSYTAAQAAYTTTTASAVPQAATQARLDLAQAKATVDLDQTILKSRTQLFSQGAIPGRDVDTARSTAQQAQAAYEIAKEKFDVFERAGQKAQVESAQGQLTSAQGKLQGAEAQLSYTEIRTPIAGVVTERPLFAGETPSAGVPLITIMDTSAMIAKLHLAQREAQQLTLGGKATLTVPGIDQPVTAKVALISPALDPGSTTVEVWLRAENPKGVLKPGTAVHATVEGRTLDHALLVPSDSVQRSPDSGGHIVMVVAGDGTAHRRNVKTGIVQSEAAPDGSSSSPGISSSAPDKAPSAPDSAAKPGDPSEPGSGLTQIVDGLDANDTIITSGGYGLDDGTKVKVEAEAPEKKPSAATDTTPAQGPAKPQAKSAVKPSSPAGAKQ